MIPKNSGKNKDEILKTVLHHTFRHLHSTGELTTYVSWKVKKPSVNYWILRFIRNLLIWREKL